MKHLSGNSKQQVIADGNPYLRVYCILAGSVERLDVESEYVFGKDIFNPSLPKFGYYTYINGFGVIDVHGHLVYDCSGKMVIDKAGEHPQQYEMMGKTLLQKTFIEIKKL